MLFTPSKLQPFQIHVVISIATIGLPCVPRTPVSGVLGRASGLVKRGGSVRSLFVLVTRIHGVPSNCEKAGFFVLRSEPVTVEVREARAPASSSLPLATKNKEKKREDRGAPEK